MFKCPDPGFRNWSDCSLYWKGSCLIHHVWELKSQFLSTKYLLDFNIQRDIGCHRTSWSFGVCRCGSLWPSVFYKGVFEGVELKIKSWTRKSQIQEVPVHKNVKEHLKKWFNKKLSSGLIKAFVGLLHPKKWGRYRKFGSLFLCFNEWRVKVGILIPKSWWFFGFGIG